MSDVVDNDIKSKVLNNYKAGLGSRSWSRVIGLIFGLGLLLFNTGLGLTAYVILTEHNIGFNPRLLSYSGLGFTLLGFMGLMLYIAFWRVKLKLSIDLGIVLLMLIMSYLTWYYLVQIMEPVAKISFFGKNQYINFLPKLVDTGITQSQNTWSIGYDFIGMCLGVLAILLILGWCTRYRVAYTVSFTTQLIIFMVCFAIGAIGLGFTPMVERSTPLPEKTFSLSTPSDSNWMVMAKDKLYPVRNTDTGGGAKAFDNVKLATPITEMSINRMANGSVFIPDQAIYAELNASDHFGKSEYRGFYSLKIPKNPHRGVWYSGGAKLLGSSEGTTLVAGHVSWSKRLRGAFYELHKVKPNTIIYVKDFDGNLGTYAITKLWYAMHTKFPPEYLSKEGENQFVIATCGGLLNRHGYYRQNVFAVAKPVTVQFE